MHDDIEITEVCIGDEAPLVGKATLIELASSGDLVYVTLSYDPPFEGRSFDTLEIHSDGEAPPQAALFAARAFARLDGYELVVPDDYYLAM